MEFIAENRFDSLKYTISWRFNKLIVENQRDYDIIRGKVRQHR